MWLQYHCALGPGTVCFVLHGSLAVEPQGHKQYVGRQTDNLSSIFLKAEEDNWTDFDLIAVNKNE